MGVNWLMIYNEVEGCKDYNEVEKLLLKCKVEKGNVFSIVKKSLGNYGYNRDYREKRNMSMTKMRERIKELESR